MNLGDLVIVLLGGTLSGLSERLEQDGFQQAAALVSLLRDACDAFTEERSAAGALVATDV